MHSTISSKGQITVPAEIRQALGLRPGTRVVFEPHPEGALLKKGSRGEHPVDRVFGCLELAAPVDQLLDEVRGKRPPARHTRAKRHKR